MSKHVIEHDGLPVGIAIAEDSILRFIAVKFDVFELDQQHFLSLAHLRQAVRGHLEQGARRAA